MMRFQTTRIPGLIEFTPSPHLDDRGFFSRTFDADVARDAGLDPNTFLQDSVSRSRRGVLRGLHVRIGLGEGKLVRCSSGAVFDVVVDLRPGSVTHGEWLSFDLNGEDQSSIFVPAGCAHGFQALTEPADVSYKIDRRHEPSENLTIAYNDPELSVPWPMRVTSMSKSDAAAPTLAELASGPLRDIAARV
jgi:dTDP-4-dehydrorhamnose 3,5-epimerase